MYRHLWPALSVLLPLLLFICPRDDITAVCFGVKRNGFKQRWGLLKEVGFVLISPFSKVYFFFEIFKSFSFSPPFYFYFYYGFYFNFRFFLLPDLLKESLSTSFYFISFHFILFQFILFLFLFLIISLIFQCHFLFYTIKDSFLIFHSNSQLLLLYIHFLSSTQILNYHYSTFISSYLPLKFSIITTLHSFLIFHSNSQLLLLYIHF